MNMETADVHDEVKVAAKLRNSPFDFHVVVDVPPSGKRSLGATSGAAAAAASNKDATVLGRYGAVLSEVAAKGKGQGRVASVTLLSQQMPFGGRDTLGGGGGGGSSSSEELLPYKLSPTQEAFLEEERRWAAWGEAAGVRIAVMRVADRVVADHDSALHLTYTSTSTSMSEKEEEEEEEEER